MSALALTIEKHHKLIIAILGAIILFFVLACVFDNVIPVCHYIFNCDHGFHS
jgi:hypothetical protein